MVAILFNIIFIILFFYYIYNIGSVQQGKSKTLITFIICVFIFAISYIFRLEFVGWIFISFTMLLFNLFYDEEPFVLQWFRVLFFGFMIAALLLINRFYSTLSHIIIYEIVLLISYLILSHQRMYLNIINCALVTIIYIALAIISVFYGDNLLCILVFILSTLAFVLLEFIFQNYQASFEKSTRYFQQNVLQHQYEEIKNIYLDMRGWRHDYHSHLQTIKAHLALNQLDEVQKYLLELEQDLSRVDSYVKSGNLMADAILNSKISIAENRNIKVICKAELPEKLSLTDIDMCVILGNLLDNATEACLNIDENKRFIRIYIAIFKKQLYMSIQNSAKEELNFNEKNYISTKRGEHGLGMKRVKILVDKYDGYLNLQNEPGIFASEVTIPLQDI